MEDNLPSYRTTMKDVAKKAGVSTATVSRTLTSPDKVSSSARSKVMQAMNELGYSSPVNPRYQKNNDSGTLLILVPDICDPFFHEIIRGIEVTAAAEGYLVLTADCAHQNLQEVSFPDKILSRQTDGLLLLGSQVPVLSELSCREQLPPLVMANEFSADLAFPTVHIDNLTAAFNATHYLQSLGHTRIACISGPEELPLCQYRVEGYIQAMRRMGMPVRDEYLVRGDFTHESGAECAAQLLALPEPPTAIFCHNDIMAIGVLWAARKQGLTLPQDLSVVGFDDLPAAQYCSPTLTTIAQPRYEIGRQSFLLLLEQLQGHTVAKGSRLLDSDLIIRESACAPKS